MQDMLPLDPYFFMRLLLNKIFFSAVLFEGFSEGVHKGFFASSKERLPLQRMGSGSEGVS